MFTSEVMINKNKFHVHQCQAQKSYVVGGWVVDQAITDPISGPNLSFVFCLLALSLTTRKWKNICQFN